MSISTTKRRNEEVNVGLSDRRKAEITAPKFDLFGETFEFAEIFSATVISSNPTNAQILVKKMMAMKSRFQPMVSRSGTHTGFVYTSFESIATITPVSYMPMRSLLIQTRVNIK